MKLIVGLGNHGEEYENTKHNLGFRVIDQLGSRVQGVKESKFKIDKLFNAEIAKGKIGEEEIVLVKPQTFMNNSGIAIKKIVTRYKLHVTQDLIVVHDDVSVDFGKIKISIGSGAGNHNGVQSIIDHLGTKDFIRVRLGIGRGEGILQDVVLSKFRPDEKENVEKMITETAEACISIVEDGIEQAMNRFN